MVPIIIIIKLIITTIIIIIIMINDNRINNDEYNSFAMLMMVHGLSVRCVLLTLGHVYADARCIICTCDT